MDINELNLNEMEEVSGGRGGSKTRLDPVPGRDVYQIKKGDTLIRIARRYNTTWMVLMDMNKGIIKDKNDITDGYWIYVPFVR